MEIAQPTLHRIKIIIEGEYLKLVKVIALIKKASEAFGFKYEVEQDK